MSLWSRLFGEKTKTATNAEKPVTSKETFSGKNQRVKPAAEYKKGEKVIFTMDAYLGSPDIGVGFLEHINVGTQAIAEGTASGDNVRISIPGVGQKNVNEFRIDSIETGEGKVWMHVGDDWVPCRYDADGMGWVHIPRWERDCEHRVALKDGRVIEGNIYGGSSKRVNRKSRYVTLRIGNAEIEELDIKAMWYRRPSKSRVFRIPE